MHPNEYKQSIQERADLVRVCDEIFTVAKVDSRSLTPAEREKIKASQDRIQSLNISITLLEAERERQRAKPVEHSPYSSIDAGGGRPGAIHTLTRFDASAAARAERSYSRLFGSPTAQGWNSLEEFFTVVNSSMFDPRLKAAAKESEGSSGGFFVPDQYAAEILDKALESEIVRPRAQVVPMTSVTRKVAGFDSLDNSSGSLYGAFTAQWLSESATITDQTPKVRAIELRARKLGLFVGSSNELIEDGASFETLLGAAMIAATGWHLDNSFLNGTGAGQPLGVLNDASLISIAKEVGQLADTILYENVVKMFSRLHPACVNNSVWVANPTTLPQLLQLTLGVGTAGVFLPAVREANGGYTLLTRPLLLTEKLPALGDKGDILLADFSQYTVGLRREISLEKSMHVGFQEDEAAYRTIVRADGTGRWGAPFKPKNGDTLSWCVTLDARA